MKPPELLETQRLLLRVPILDDTNAVFRKYAQDAEVTKYLVWRPHENIDETREFMQRCVQCWEDESAFPWVIIRKSDNELLGMIEMRIDGFRADFGYVIARQYWGNGYVPEVAKTVIEWTLKQESIFRVWVVCDLENPASARVMEKIGMQKEGILRRFVLHPNISSEPRDCYCYSIVK